MEQQWNERYPQNTMNAPNINQRPKPKVMGPSMVLGIVGSSLLGLAFFLEMIAGFAFLSNDGYNYSSFPGFMSSMGTAFFYCGIGLLGIGIILALKKR